MQLDDDFLAKSIAAAFDRLAEPEAARLEGTEHRLIGHLSRSAPARCARTGWWWLIVVLAATGAAAAWWGNAHFGRDTSRVEAVVQEPAISNKTPPESPMQEPVLQTETPGKAPPEPTSSSPEIFRQEKY